LSKSKNDSLLKFSLNQKIYQQVDGRSNLLYMIWKKFKKYLKYWMNSSKQRKIDLQIWNNWLMKTFLSKRKKKSKSKTFSSSRIQEMA
jgi:hypothetical protein